MDMDMDMDTDLAPNAGTNRLQSWICEVFCFFLKDFKPNVCVCILLQMAA